MSEPVKSCDRQCTNCKCYCCWDDGDGRWDIGCLKNHDIGTEWQEYTNLAPTCADYKEEPDDD